MWRFTRKTIVLLWRAGEHLVANDGVEHAGYLTFLGMLSVFPFLVFLVAVAGFMGQGQLGQQFINLVMHHLPHDAVGAFAPRLDEITSGPPKGLLTVAILGAIWTASGALESMRTVLNRAYKVHERPHFALRRLVSILQILLFAALIIAVMSILVLAPVVLMAFTSLTGIAIPPVVERFFVEDFIYIGACVLLFVVSFLYYWLPNIKQSLLAVVPGAILVVLLWLGGAALVTFYLDKISTVNVIYGSLSSIIAAMIFFYVMNVIFIYGAEFNHQLLVVLHKRIVGKDGATVSLKAKMPRKRARKIA